ncbi:UDP-glucose 4-epimerase family protein [Halomonas mongoliensis]|uniref:UDP-glucose 4-epimerase family protein n=1 Tax=Halomonas mongoliensis TaxID=321265 RepID=UPI00403B2DDB
MKAMITGATGFVGQGVLERLNQQAKWVPYLALRRPPSAEAIQAHSYTLVGDITPETDWHDALIDCQAVVHCAARVHVMDDPEVDPLAAFREANVAGTLNLARQAAESGIKRFVFISSIKVNGEQTSADRPFQADDTPAPSDPYGISKHEAEQGLLALAEETGMEVVIIRSPLVYGPGVKANFASLMRWLQKGVPLPLGAIHNQRSLVARGNLVDLIVTCLDHPDAANQIFLAGDGEDLSTTQLLRRMGQALGKPARLVPVPAGLLEAGAAVLGKRDVAQRLCGSLCVDIGKAQRLIGWQPPISIETALQETADAFLNEQNTLQAKDATP